MADYATAVEGIGIDDIKGQPAHPTLRKNRKWKYTGTTTTGVAGAAANQALGFVTLPALGAGASGTVTYTNSLITANSVIKAWTQLGPVADATAGREVNVWLESRTGGSCVIGYHTAA